MRRVQTVWQLCVIMCVGVCVGECIHDRAHLHGNAHAILLVINRLCVNAAYRMAYD